MIFMQVEPPGVEKLSVAEKRKERKIIFNLLSHVHQFLIGFILSNLSEPIHFPKKQLCNFRLL